MTNAELQVHRKTDHAIWVAPEGIILDLWVQANIVISSDKATRITAALEDDVLAVSSRFRRLTRPSNPFKVHVQ